MDRFLTTVDEVSLRTKTIPVDPQDPNGPVQVVRLKGESDYNSDRIRYKFPLEIKIPWFFDADLDVTMDVSFSLENTIENSILDFFVAFKIDASFDVGEHILSAVLPFPLGATFGIQKTLDTVLPMVFDCQVPAIEARLASFIVDDNVKSILKEMTEGRIFDIRISPVSATSNTNSLLLVLCPRTREAET
jgi:hypothetical protein